MQIDTVLHAAHMPMTVVTIIVVAQKLIYSLYHVGYNTYEEFHMKKHFYKIAYHKNDLTTYLAHSSPSYNVRLNIKLISK